MAEQREKCGKLDCKYYGKDIYAVSAQCIGCERMRQVSFDRYERKSTEKDKPKDINTENISYTAMTNKAYREWKRKQEIMAAEDARRRIPDGTEVTRPGHCLTYKEKQDLLASIAEKERRSQEFLDDPFLKNVGIWLTQP